MTRGPAKMFRVPANTPALQSLFGQAREFDVEANEDRQARRCEDGGRNEHDPGDPAGIPGWRPWLGMRRFLCQDLRLWVLPIRNADEVGQ
jgi:hypothetical protein